MKKIKNVLVWGLTILAIVALWISLRTDEKQLEYTLAALAIWGLGFLVNRYLKIEE